MILGAVIALIALWIQIKQYRSKNKIPSFKGRIGVDCNDGKPTNKLYEFVRSNDGSIIFLNINLDNDDNYELDSDGVFTFSYYYDKSKVMDGGFTYRIKTTPNDDFFFDSRPISLRLKGYFKVLGLSGPQQGWFAAIMKPVSIESIKNRL